MGYLVKPLRAQELSLAIELAITRVHEFVALREENSPERTSEVRKLIERAKGLNVARVQIINSP